MFGFWKRGERANIVKQVHSLALALDHVGVHEAEQVGLDEHGFCDTLPTAENVVLRLVDERDAYRDMVDGPSVEHLQHELIVARRNLAYERQAHNKEAAYLHAQIDALRASAFRMAELTVRPPVPMVFTDAQTTKVVDVIYSAPAEPVTVEPTLREQALAVIDSIKQPDGSFDAAEAFDIYSTMAGGRYVVGEFLWDFEGLTSLGYAHDEHSELGGRRCVWRPVRD